MKGMTYVIIGLLCSINSLWSAAVSAASFTEQDVYALRRNGARKALAHVAQRRGNGPLADQILTALTLPKINVLLSGGGNVAALASLGVLQGLDAGGAQDPHGLGLMPAIQSVIGLSGSTWLLASWLKHGSNLHALEDRLRQQLESCLRIDSQLMIDCYETLKLRHGEGKKFGLNDIWGEALAKIYLDAIHYRETHYFHHYTDSLRTGQYPYTILTTITQPKRSATDCFKKMYTKNYIEPDDEYRWIEISPITTQVTGVPGTAISTEFFGCDYKNGVRNTQSAPITAAYLLGLCGSAYAVNMQNLIDLGNKSGSWFAKSLRGLPSTRLNTFRFATPVVGNFLRDLKRDQPETSKPLGSLINQDELEVVDAGMDLKIPFPPLLHRLHEARSQEHPGLIIVVDVSSDAHYGNGQQSLSQAALYARKHGIAFPDINERTILSDRDGVIFIHDNNKPLAPIIIYIKTNLEESILDADYSVDQFNRMQQEMLNAIRKEETVDMIIQAVGVILAEQKVIDDRLARLSHEPIDQKNADSLLQVQHSSS